MKRASVRRDTRGAMLLLGLFFCVLGAGFLYYIAGIAEAVILRERMQDAADATAFSAAIIHARGMNILALINILMAVVVAILVLLRLLSSILRAAAVFATVAAFFSFGAGLAAAQYLERSAKLVDKAYETAQKPVRQTLKVGHQVAVAVRHAVPAVAQAKALSLSREHYAPPALGAIVFPIHTSLPTADGSFSRTCAKAGEYVGDLIAWPLEKIGVPSIATGFVERAIEGTVTQFAGYFCGASPTPPSYHYDEEVQLPRLPGAEARACAGGDADACIAETERREAAYAVYDLDLGACPESDEEAARDCRRLLEEARRVCEPGEGEAEDWRVTMRTIREIYRVVEGPGGARVTLTVEEGPLENLRWFENPTRHLSLGFAPCKTLHGRPWSTWNREAGEPLCERRHDDPPTLHTFEALGRDEIVIEYQRIEDVLSCIAEESRSLDLESEKLGDDDKTPPQEICSCARQGQGLFQLRAFVFGNYREALATSRRRMKVLEVVSGPTRRESTAVQRLADAFGKVAFAQAEYYVSGEHVAHRDEWMWHMTWKARMRRFHVDQDPVWRCEIEKPRYACPEPLGELDGGDGSVCTGACAKALDAVDGVVLH